MNQTWDRARILVDPDASPEALYGELLADLGNAARAFRFQVAPNPCVGGSILSDGVEIGRGFHQVWGGAHAEVMALDAAAASGIPMERWDTLVVSLEPCSSQGKTAPCTDAILQAGIKRVVVGCEDPDPRHRGRSLELLREAGLDVILLPHATPLSVVAPHFAAWTDPDRIRRKRTWTVAKWAQTRTGQLSPPEGVGDGRWISGPAFLAEVQVLRGRVDAIVTGIGTVRADDPRLTVREPGDRSAPPLRVVLDSDLRISPEARLLQPLGDDEAGGALHILARPGAAPARHRALTAAGAEVHALRPGDDGKLSLFEVHAWLWDRGVRRVLLEAGATLLTSFFDAELVDQIAVCTGDVNGGEGPSLAEKLTSPRLSGVERREVGTDSLLEGFYGLP